MSQFKADLGFGVPMKELKVKQNLASKGIPIKPALKQKFDQAAEERKALKKEFLEWLDQEFPLTEEDDVKIQKPFPLSDRNNSVQFKLGPAHISMTRTMQSIPRPDCSECRFFEFQNKIADENEFTFGLDPIQIGNDPTPGSVKFLSQENDMGRKRYGTYCLYLVVAFFLRISLSEVNPKLHKSMRTIACVTYAKAGNTEEDEVDNRLSSCIERKNKLGERETMTYADWLFSLSELAMKRNSTLLQQCSGHFAFVFFLWH